MMQVQQAWDHPVYLEHLRWELDRGELGERRHQYMALISCGCLAVPQGQVSQLLPGQLPPQLPFEGSVPLSS
jgi:hypothetical protein